MNVIIGVLFLFTFMVLFIISNRVFIAVKQSQIRKLPTIEGVVLRPTISLTTGTIPFIRGSVRNGILSLHYGGTVTTIHSNNIRETKIVDFLHMHGIRVFTPEQDLLILWTPYARRLKDYLDRHKKSQHQRP